MELGTALALAQFADQCIKYGEKLVRRCQNYRHAEKEARELLISIEVNWMKTEAQINFLKRIAHALNPRYCDVQSRVLSELEGKLKTATLTMGQLISHEKEQEKEQEKEKEKEKEWEKEKEKENEREKDKDVDFAAVVKALGKMSPMKKVRYAFEKDSLNRIINDLENWQRRFDPSWMLIMRMADDKIDQQLDQEERKSKQSQFIMAAKGVRDAARESTSTLVPDGSIFKPADARDTDEAPIPFSSVLISYLTDTKEHILVDKMICNPKADIVRTTRDVRKLARTLSKVDPLTFGLLACRGVVKGLTSQGTDKPINTFEFLFAIPPTVKNPKSLRTLLLEGDAAYPLNSRFDLAKQLTNSVLFVHSSQFVHKNIRPETIIVFENDATKIGSSFLVGFEKFRPAEELTYRVGDGIWNHDLYRHPSRQGTQPEEDYQMQHDIYSLGVVLLELGLWQSFITFPTPPPSPSDPSPSPTPTPAPILADITPPITQVKDPRKRAAAIKAALTKLADDQLPARMGRKYCDIVLLCLQCLDGSPSPLLDTASTVTATVDAVDDFDDVYDEDGIVVGVRYIERILLRMQEISI